MVWGMALPKSFGEFWPDGVFEADGWYDRLKSHYLKEESEDQNSLFGEGGKGALNYMGYAAAKFVSEVGSVSNPDHPSFTPIQPYEVPRSFDIEQTHASLGSLIMLNDRILAVNEPLKGIIEALEPGVHQFYPIEMRSNGGSVHLENYFILVIGQYLNSFSASDSDSRSWRVDWQNYYFYEETKKGIEGLAFSKDIFSDSHLWRERYASNMLICLSDQLEAEIANAGLSIPKHDKSKEV